jgi:hypothetical protein
MSKEFQEWWYNTGSGITPIQNEDQHEHARRVAASAWNAIAAELNDRIEELEYEIRDLASRYDS